MSIELFFPRVVIEERPPLNTDDNTHGYVLGQPWLDTSTNRYYICKDVTTDAAVWELCVTPVDLQTEKTMGESSYAGLGSEVSIAHGFNVIPSYVNATPNSPTDGYLGEVWIRKDETNIYVGNTGSHTGTFNWVAYK